jgi:hypothetical protein
LFLTIFVHHWCLDLFHNMMLINFKLISLEFIQDFYLMKKRENKIRKTWADSSSIFKFDWK